ncbi:hypothetical protein QBC47DRAFT_405347 [Echria macrotheca]|uniref:Uncharacterized protein n=1 Tax=Echria macrotheca TaxID=438768 RepID=A0AAJ0F8I1_9PEZI|nr:hypothetical protein QBC47DRAFT_405347 [Echria macrotheca]
MTRVSKRGRRPGRGASSPPPDATPPTRRPRPAVRDDHIEDLHPLHQTGGTGTATHRWNLRDRRKRRQAISKAVSILSCRLIPSDGDADAGPEPEQDSPSSDDAEAAEKATKPASSHRPNNKRRGSPLVGPLRTGHPPEVDKVPAVKELPPPLASGQPNRSQGWSFWFFAPEIRNMIYGFACIMPTASQLYAGYNRSIDAWYARGRKGPFPTYDKSSQLKTPTILLLCRAITAECLPILRSRQFVVDRLPPWLPGHGLPMALTDFISPRTIQNLRHIDIRCPLGQGRLGSGWVWYKLVKDLIGILSERNAFEDLRVIISIFNFYDFLMWQIERPVLRNIQQDLELLKTNNPRFWAPGRVEEEFWIIKGHKAYRHRLRTERDVHLESLHEIKYYPFDGHWPGGMLEFT